MGAIILVVAPLVHIYLPKKNANVEAYKDALEDSTVKLTNALEQLHTTYKDSDRPASEYLAKESELRTQLAALMDKNERLIIAKVDEERYWGWKTKRTFWMGFGIRLPLLIMAIIISILISNRQSDQKYRSRALMVLQTVCYGVALYQVIWCFWHAQDYPLSTYWYAMLSFTLVSGAFITYQFRYYVSVMGLLHKVKADFMDFLVEVRNVHYKPMLKRAIKFGGLYDEALQEEIDQGTKQLENRLHEKATELIED